MLACEGYALMTGWIDGSSRGGWVCNDDVSINDRDSLVFFHLVSSFYQVAGFFLNRAHSLYLAPSFVTEEGLLREQPNPGVTSHMTAYDNTAWPSQCCLF